MEKKFRITIGSPIDYEELVAYIDIEGERIALINKEEGVNKLKIEFFNEPPIDWVYFDVLIEAFQEAKKELLK